MPNDVAGFSLAAISTFLSGLGYVLQKMGHSRRNADVTPKKIFMYWQWSAGLVCMVTAAGVATACFSLLDQSKQAPMGALTIVWNLTLAGILLREKVTVLDAICTVLIVGGTILAVTMNNSPSHAFTFEEIVSLLSDKVVYGYSSTLIPVLVCSVIFLEWSVRRGAAKWGKLQRAIISFAAPLTGGMSNGFVAYCIKASMTVITGKDWDQFKQPLVYVYSIAGILCVLAQVRYLNVGLQNFTALQVVPAFQTAVIFSNAVAGIVYYHDMRNSPAQNLALFALGAMICISGISLLRLKAASVQAPPPPVSGAVPLQSLDSVDGEVEKGEKTPVDGVLPSTGPGGETPEPSLNRARAQPLLSSLAALKSGSASGSANAHSHGHGSTGSSALGHSSRSVEKASLLSSGTSDAQQLYGATITVAVAVGGPGSASASTPLSPSKLAGHSYGTALPATTSSSSSSSSFDRQTPLSSSSSSASASASAAVGASVAGGSSSGGDGIAGSRRSRGESLSISAPPQQLQQQQQTSNERLSRRSRALSSSLLAVAGLAPEISHTPVPPIGSPSAAQAAALDGTGTAGGGDGGFVDRTSTGGVPSRASFRARVSFSQGSGSSLSNAHGTISGLGRERGPSLSTGLGVSAASRLSIAEPLAAIDEAIAAATASPAPAPAPGHSSGPSHLSALPPSYQASGLSALSANGTTGSSAGASAGSSTAPAAVVVMSESSSTLSSSSSTRATAGALAGAPPSTIVGAAGGSSGPGHGPVVSYSPPEIDSGEWDFPADIKPTIYTDGASNGIPQAVRWYDIELIHLPGIIRNALGR